MESFPRQLFSFSCIPLAAGLFLLLPFILAGWPLDGLEISDAGHPARAAENLFRAPVLLGRGMTTTIIHSVQLTPVIDEYRIQEGRLWAWREKILSHNAGLPSLRPEQGRFTFDPPWMIVEGTRESWEHFFYRVGTEDLGKNVLCVTSFPCRNLWESVPGKRLRFRAVPVTLFSGSGFETF